MAWAVTCHQHFSFAQVKEKNAGLCPLSVQGVVLTGLVFSTRGRYSWVVPAPGGCFGG